MIGILKKKILKEILSEIWTKSPASLANLILISTDFSKDALAFSIENKVAQTIYSSDIETLCRAFTKVLNERAQNKEVFANCLDINNLIINGNSDKAVAMLNKLRAKNPSDEYKLKLASIYFYKNQNAKAMGLLNELARRRPQLRVFDLMSRIHLKEKQYKEAMTALYSAPEFKPSNYAHIGRIANLFCHSKLGQKRIKELEDKMLITNEQLPKKPENKVVELETFNRLIRFFNDGIHVVDKASLFNSLAIFSNFKKRHNEAAKYYVLAYVFGYENKKLCEKVLVNLAAAQSKLENFDEAKACYELILETNPLNTKAEHNLKVVQMLIQKKERESLNTPDTPLDNSGS